jgi:hypothetical protein
MLLEANSPLPDNVSWCAVPILPEAESNFSKLGSADDDTMYGEAVHD